MNRNSINALVRRVDVYVCALFDGIALPEHVQHNGTRDELLAYYLDGDQPSIRSDSKKNEIFYGQCDDGTVWFDCNMYVNDNFTDLMASCSYDPQADLITIDDIHVP